MQNSQVHLHLQRRLPLKSSTGVQLHSRMSRNHPRLKRRRRSRRKNFRSTETRINLQQRIAMTATP